MPTSPPIFRPPGHKPRQQRAVVQRQYDRTQRRNRDVYGSQRWRETSERHRSAHPLCADCEAEGVTRAAEVVDHVIPIERDRSLAFEPTNLRSLCKLHHARKTARDADHKELPK